MFLYFLSISEIIHIGELKLHNGREIFSSNPHLLSNNENGWYYIHIINSTNYDFLLKHGVSISTKSFINPQWICAYLSTEQIEKISQFLYITEVLPSDKIQDESYLLESTSFIIYAHESFDQHKGNFQKIYKNYYVTKTYTPQLLEDRTILRIYPYNSPQLFNRFSRGITQQEKFKVEFNDLLLIPDLPMYKHGIKGTGQVVTIIDSGLDHRSCFFKDKDYPPPINVTNYNHRKIIRYEPFSDASESIRGHGTHVSGIAAGNADCSQCTTCNGLSQCSISLYNGHAPDAKIYFIDVGDSFDNIDASFDLEYVIDTARSFGSHIFSCSWGSAPEDDDYIRLMYDEIGFDNPDFIFFFAAGNSRKAFDTYAPANSKNIVAVGGVNQPRATSVFSNSNSYIYLETTNGNEKRKNRCDFSKNYNLFEKATTNDPLSNFTNQKIGEKFVFIENDEQCHLIDANEENNTSLYITVNSLINCPAFQKVPQCILMTSETGFLRNGTIASIVPEFISEKNGPSYKMYSLTSLGPSIVGLVKPDILAPGTSIKSAYGTSLRYKAPQCNIEDGIRSKSGTSMATPAAAGATALIVQYFSDGFYPSGKRTVNLPNRSNYDKIEPSMTLLKAILTNSAGTISSSSKIPDCSKGFGVLHVSEALLFDDETEKMKRFGLRISGKFYVTGEEREDFVSEINLLNENKELERKSLIVTLTWLDPPMSGASSLYPIYADLDLFIECPDGKVVYGNQIDEDNEEMYSTTERVTIENPIGGKYKIHVTCPKLLKKVKILPSVVVNGPFNHLDFGTNPKFLEFTKVKDNMMCTFNKTGHFCQHNVTEIMNNGKVTFALKNRIPKHFCTLFNGGKVMISFPKGTKNTLHHVYISMNQVHKFGGELLYFNSPSSSTTFKISEDIVPKGTYIYITVIELVNNNGTEAEIKIIGAQPINSPSQSPIQTIIETPIPTPLIESEGYEPIVDDAHEFLTNFIQFNKKGYMTNQANYSITNNSANIILVKSHRSQPTIKVSTTNDKPNYATFVSPQHKNTQIIILNPSSECINYGSGQIGVHANENVSSIILPKTKVPLNLYSKGQSSFPFILDVKESSKSKLLLSKDFEKEPTISLNNLIVHRGTIQMKLPDEFNEIKFNHVDSYMNGVIEFISSNGSSAVINIQDLKLNNYSNLKVKNAFFNGTIASFSNSVLEVYQSAVFNDNSIVLSDTSLINFGTSKISGICKEIKLINIDSSSRFLDDAEEEFFVELICGANFNCNNWKNKFVPSGSYKSAICIKKNSQKTFCLAARNKKDEDNTKQKKKFPIFAIVGIVLGLLIVITIVIVVIICIKKKKLSYINEEYRLEILHETDT